MHNFKAWLLFAPNVADQQDRLNGNSEISLWIEIENKFIILKVWKKSNSPQDHFTFNIVQFFKKYGTILEGTFQYSMKKRSIWWTLSLKLYERITISWCNYIRIYHFFKKTWSTFFKKWSIPPFDFLDLSYINVLLCINVLQKTMYKTHEIISLYQGRIVFLPSWIIWSNL